MSVVIRFVGMAGYAVSGAVKLPVGAYLHWFNVDAHGGRGDVRWTTDPKQALRFEDMAAATEAWRQQSTVRPTRGDGKPNRPMTAFTVTMEPLP
jgi:hypothetical protein